MRKILPTTTTKGVATMNYNKDEKMEYYSKKDWNKNNKSSYQKKG